MSPALPPSMTGQPTEWAVIMSTTRTVAAIGKCGGDVPRVSTCAAVLPSPLAGQEQGHPGAVAVASPEERQPRDMVPVQVGEQDRASEGLAAEQRGDPAQAGAGVQDQSRPGRAVGGERDTRGVAAVTEELPARRWGRPADTAQVDAHPQPRPASSRP